ncbi:hypothetical protein H4R33_000394 [Dimargaris cristalligena]|nr:hypothetical protein H4R33_000394 [Dimargaris cristalligena]
MKPDKEKLNNLQDLQAQLDVSIYETRSLVASWLQGTDKKATKDRAAFLKRDFTEAELDNSSHGKAREVFKGRPNRLGIGAAPPPTGQPGQKNPSLESGSMVDNRLKRKLVGHPSRINSETRSYQAATGNSTTLAAQPESDDEDSRTRSFRQPPKHDPSSTTPSTGPKSTRIKGDFLDQFMSERKKKKNKK